MKANEMPEFKKLSAKEQLKLEREYPKLLPVLLQLGLGAEDAVAVSYNCTLLYRVLAVSPPLDSPAGVLERYDLGEIAQLCGDYRRVCVGVLEYGGAGGDAL